jgi:hypothetical protein
MQKDVPLRITGDWVIELSDTGANEKIKAVVLNLGSPPFPYVPRAIKTYLENSWVINIPASRNHPDEQLAGCSNLREVQRQDGDRLTLTQVPQNDIQVFQTEKVTSIYNKKDFFQNKGKDAVMIYGLEPEFRPC